VLHLAATSSEADVEMALMLLLDAGALPTDLTPCTSLYKSSDRRWCHRSVLWRSKCAAPVGSYRRCTVSMMQVTQAK
jgi:hypothetical protein